MKNVTLPDYKKLTKESSIVTITKEEASESGDSYCITVRVINPSKWKAMIHTMLTASFEEETFGLSVRQEFYLNEENSPAFVWSILLWGDLEAAHDALSPILSKRGAPPPPPKSLNLSTSIQRNGPVERTYRTKDSVVTEISLPFKRATSSVDKGEVINVRNGSSTKIRAFVEGVKS